MEQREAEANRAYLKKIESRKAREQRCAEKVNASRAKEKKPITLETVVSGLKFIAEHQSMDWEELVDGLLDLGCNFSFEDIEEQFPERVFMREGMRKGAISCGAGVIVNVRDTERGIAYCKDWFLSLDNDCSIYHFIRVTTGDETYTKESIDALSSNSGKHR